MVISVFLFFKSPFKKIGGFIMPHGNGQLGKASIRGDFIMFYLLGSNNECCIPCGGSFFCGFDDFFYLFDDSLDILTIFLFRFFIDKLENLFETLYMLLSLEMLVFKGIF